MMHDGMVHEKAKEPLCKQVAEQLFDAYTSILEHVDWDAWMMTGYAWF